MRTTIVLLGLSFLVPLETAAQDVLVPNRLSLQEALHLAEVRSPHLAAARQLAELAKSDVTGAARRPNPAVTVKGEAYPTLRIATSVVLERPSPDVPIRSGDRDRWSSGSPDGDRRHGCCCRPC